MVSVHPEEGVIACSNGRRFETHNFYEKQYDDRKRGWWYRNPYARRHHIHGTVLDLDFNSANHELVVILSNGEIIFCHEKYCGYHGSWISLQTLMSRPMIFEGAFVQRRSESS